MSIISWNDLLGDLLYTAKQCDHHILADLEQLEGLCKKLEDIEFMPFTEDDLSIQTAKNIERYYMVIDDVIDLLKQQNELTPIKVSNRPGFAWSGFHRYIDVWKIGIGIGFSTSLWKMASSVTSPFWIWFYHNDVEELRDAVNCLISSIPKSNIQIDKNGYRCLAVIPPCDKSREDVAKQITEQIMSYIRFIKTNYESIIKEKQ